jgi:hypothetical protein
MSDYEIGYAKPPERTRWKKGQSGNPRGRPKKPLPQLSIDTAEIIRRLDAELITVGGQTMTRREAELCRLKGLEIQGNKQARRLLDRLRSRIKVSIRAGVMSVPWKPQDYRS